jgi:hypothetical protein
MTELSGVAPEPDYVLVFTHPETTDTTQLPKPVEKIPKEGHKLVQYLISVVKMIIFY